MKTHRNHARELFAMICAAVLFSWPVLAKDAGIDPAFRVAQSDCYSIGQQVATQNGGTLAKASQAEQDGQPVCIIVVLTPGKDGQRPRRQEIVVPQ